MIVFPEDGIYGMMMTRTGLTPYLEYIPDPNLEDWCPCCGPTRYTNSDVQIFLSCLAKNNTMYVVANFGDFQPCNKTSSPDCPVDRHYQYNTDLVYDKTGKLVARYHKENLFYEFQFDKPNATEFVYFDTTFGRFGVFTCFDIMFHDPAIALIQQFNVTNVAFPTAWMDALPLLGAIQFHSAFAAGAGVNFLAANIHRPEDRFHGSGIYTPGGAVAYYYDSKSKDGRLLISEVSVIGKCDSQKETNDTETEGMRMDKLYFQSEKISDSFNSYVFHDLFTFEALSQNGTYLTVCQKSLCCHLEYEYMDTNSSELIAFGAFDGLHTYQGKYYLQICALIKCASDRQSTCGTETKQSSTKFRFIKMHATFNMEYVFPEILMAENEELILAKPKTWTFENNTLSIFKTSAPLLSAALFGRVYTNDSDLDPI